MKLISVQSRGNILVRVKWVEEPSAVKYRQEFRGYCVELCAILQDKFELINSLYYFGKERALRAAEAWLEGVSNENKKRTN